MDAGKLQQVEGYWANELGLSANLLRVPGCTVLPGPDGSGAFIFKYRKRYVWQVPERFVPRIKEIIATHPDASLLFQQDSIRQMFGPAAQLILGPCPIAYVGNNSPRPDRGAHDCRKLAEEDRASMENLAIACGTEAWEHGGVEFRKHRYVSGCFAQGQLVSAASYEIWGDVIAHVGVATAPAHRGKGFGRAAAWAATNHALNQGLVPQWRTLESNMASVAIGKSLGFTVWATHYFVRLLQEPRAGGVPNS